MDADNINYRDYILGKVDERERLAIQYRCYKDEFRAVVEQLLDEWGLAEKLKAALANKDKVRVLDVGCGTGLFLQEVAAIIEERGLLQAAQFFGIDIDQAVIVEAEKLSKEIKPPRNYLHFYVHDVTKPLSSCKGFLFDIDGPVEFDFIFFSFALEHFPQARLQLEKFYQALRPGGIIFIRDGVNLVGDYGWKSPHPLMEQGFKNVVKLIASVNDGVLVTNEAQNWLREFGASRVEIKEFETPLGGTTQVGLDMLRNLIMAKRNFLPTQLKLGLTTQAQFDAEMQQLYRELGPACVGHVNVVDTLARKPE